MTSGKIKPLSAPFADPKDKTGFSALSEVPAQMNTYYPVDRWDLKIEEVLYADKAIGDVEPEEGEVLMVLGGTAKNSSPESDELNWATFRPNLRDTDGNDIEWTESLLQSNRDADVRTDVKTGQEIKFRMPFRVPTGVLPSTLAIGCGEECRQYVFDVSGYEPPKGTPKSEE